MRKTSIKAILIVLGRQELMKNLATLSIDLYLKETNSDYESLPKIRFFVLSFFGEVIYGGGDDYKIITKVPIVIKMQPMIVLNVGTSCRKKKAKTRVMTRLNLSTADTSVALPICKAL